MSIPTVLITRVRLAAPEGVIEDGWIKLSGGRIEALGAMRGGLPEGLPDEQADIQIDGRGGWVLPGFIDIHVHGGFGHDFMDADKEGLDAITRFHARHGTTAMLATTVTAPKDALDGVLSRVKAYIQAETGYAQLLGVHLEGPFISAKYPGAQNPAHIAKPDPAWLDDWLSRFPGLIKMQTLAPETESALAYIRKLNEAGIVAACGHTDASYDQLSEAAECGLRHAVHTFNAMRPVHHREPGTVGAVLTDDRITAEVIADGHHVHPACIRLLARTKGSDRLVLITDAMSAAGLGNGDYQLGGLDVTVKDGVARLKDGDSLAGSTLTMIDAFRFAVRNAGIGVAEASRMASANPARVISAAHETGSLKAGMRADVLLLDEDLKLDGVWIGGKPAAL